MITKFINELRIKLKLKLKGRVAIIFKNGQVYHLHKDRDSTFFWSEWWPQLGNDVESIM